MMNKEDYSGIWVYAEQENGVLSETTFELLAKSHDLKEKLGNRDEICAVVAGDSVAQLAGTLFSYGAEKVIAAENINLKTYSARPYANVLTELCDKYLPSIFLFPASPQGRDVAPRVMCELLTGLTADAIDLDIDEDGVFVQTTPNFGGNILSHICIKDARPQMVTVHPKVFEPMKPVPGADGTLIVEQVSVEADDCYTVLSSEKRVFEGRPIAGSNVIVAGGRGIKSPEDLAQLKELAELLGGELASSRPLVDKGWLPHEKQIGQSGTTVKPDFILNVAISGSVQYLAGMQKAKCIMSINNFSEAPIWDVSNYGAVSDYSKLIPAIIAEIRTRRK